MCDNLVRGIPGQVRGGERFRWPHRSCAAAFALARGTRSLIVTHWRVRNDLGPVLLPAMLAKERTYSGATSAEPMREAMLVAMRDDAILGWDPAQWAANVLVGDANWSRRAEQGSRP